MELSHLTEQLELISGLPVTQVSLTDAKYRVKVDMDARRISINDIMGIQYDHLAKNVVFEITRFVGAVDLSEKHCALHWENGTNGGVLPLTDIDLSEDGTILLRWEVTSEFTQHAGDIVFALHFFSIVDGAFTYHIATYAAAGKLGTTLNASDHSAGIMSPSEIEKLIQAVNEMNAAVVEVSMNTAKSREYMEQAKMYSENAAAVAGVEIATKNTAGLMKGGENAVDEDGSLVLMRKVYGSRITADDSHAGGLKLDKLYGKSVQETVPGNQLFDMNATPSNSSACSVEGNIITITSSSAKDYVSCSWDIDIDADKIGSSIYLKIQSIGVSGINNAMASLRFCDESGTVLGRIDMNSGNKTHSSVIPDTCAYVKLVLYATYNNTCNAGDYATYENVMVSYIKTDWEPYCGGIPSPNPEYSQPIVSAGQKLVDGVVSDVGIEHKLTGKNLLWNIATTKTINGVTFTVNEDKSVTVNGTATALTTLIVFSNNITKRLPTNQDYILSGCPAGGSATSYRLQFYNINGEGEFAYDFGSGKTFNLTNKSYKYNVAIIVHSGATVSNLTFKPMLRLASIEDDTYEPYTEQTLTLNRTLPAIPVTDASLATYTDENGQMWCSDEIDVERGVYVQRISDLVLMGTEPWKGMTVSHNVWAYYLWVSGIFFKSNLMCTHYVYGGADYSKAQFVTAHLGSGYYIWIKDDNYADVDTLKAMLAEQYASGTPVTVRYILNTPIETPLTDEEIIALHSLKTYDGVTHIMTDSDPAPMLEVEYGTSKVGAYTLESLNIAKKNEVNINAMQNAILSMGGNV